MSNPPLNVQALQDQLNTLAKREGISQWDLGASRVPAHRYKSIVANPSS